MPLNDLNVVDHVISGLRAANRRQAIESICATAAQRLAVGGDKLAARMLARERSSVTSGIGGGVAILHLTLRDIEKPFVMLARAVQRIDFNAVDGEPVDLVLLVLSPAADGPVHLQRLARFSRLLRDRALCARLRGADTDDALHAVLYAGTEQRFAA